MRPSQAHSPKEIHPPRTPVPPIPKTASPTNQRIPASKSRGLPIPRLAQISSLVLQVFFLSPYTLVIVPFVLLPIFPLVEDDGDEDGDGDEDLGAEVGRGIG